MIAHIIIPLILMSTNLRTTAKGAYNRHASKHRSVIGSPSHPPAGGRYHLHIALACPWADGALSALYLKGLENVISHSIVHPTWAKTKPNDDSDIHHGWVFRKPGDEPLSNPLGHGSFDCDDALVPDSVTNCQSIREVYEKAGDFEGPYTTPILFDKETNTIVSNESVEILRMLNDEFNEFAEKPDANLFPKELDETLDKLNKELVYPNVNNGVYRCGFAKSQEAYNKAVSDLFSSLEELESLLGNQRYLGGEKFTFLDLRLFHTLVRFDPVYITYFKTNQKRLVDFPNLLGFVRDVYSIEGVKKSVNIKHIKTHYFTSHPTLNTYGIIPVYDGPDLNVPRGADKDFHQK
jgi:putative glutathione S-transferase